MPGPSFAAVVAALSLVAFHAGAPAGDGGALRPEGHDYTVVHSFDSNMSGSDGVTPGGGVLPLPDGSLLGVTALGGAHGDGVIYRIAQDGTETVVHDFDAAKDGTSPDVYRLLLASDGRVYGVAEFGGSPDFAGTIYRIDPDGSNFVVLHAFGAAGGPLQPSSPLIEASDGMFYGTSFFGGFGEGTVYRMTPGGEVTVLHAFAAGRREGSLPNAVVQATDGAFYGTSQFGGARDDGTFYRIGKDGRFKLLHDFDASSGTPPTGAFVQAADGAFFGAAFGDGPRGQGTIYRIESDGTLTVMHAFGNEAGEGRHPIGLMQAPDGMFFGTTLSGGAEQGDGNGTLYRMNALGEFRTLRKFVNFYGGVNPQDNALALGPDGLLYGTCLYGGHHHKKNSQGGMGTVFRILPGKAGR